VFFWIFFSQVVSPPSAASTPSFALLVKTTKRRQFWGLDACDWLIRPPLPARTRPSGGPPAQTTIRSLRTTRPTFQWRFCRTCTWETRRTQPTSRTCTRTGSSTFWTWRRTCRTCSRTTTSFSIFRFRSVTIGRRTWPHISHRPSPSSVSVTIRICTYWKSLSFVGCRPFLF